jgi:hypothetical protein
VSGDGGAAQSSFPNNDVVRRLQDRNSLELPANKKTLAKTVGEQYLQSRELRR